MADSTPQCDGTASFSDTKVAIRTATSGELRTIHQWTVLEDWLMSYEDIVMIYTAKPEDLFVAHLDNKVVGCICAWRLGEKYGMLGMVLVDPAFRRRGIARQLLIFSNQHMKIKDGERVVGLNGRQNVVPFYRKYGYTNTAFDVFIIQGVPDIAAFVKAFPGGCDLDITRPSNYYFHKLAAYDDKISPIERHAWLRLFLQREDVVTLMAMEGDRVVGYGSIRLTERLYKIGPLYADSAAIAATLLAALFKQEVDGVLSKGVSMETLHPNTEVRRMVSSLGLTEYYRLQRQYANGEVSIDTDKVFAIFNTDTVIV